MSGLRLADPNADLLLIQADRWFGFQIELRKVKNPKQQYSICIPTRTLNTTPSILRDMMRELLATTTVLCTFTTVRSHSRTVRTGEVKRALLLLFVGGGRTHLLLALVV